MRILSRSNFSFTLALLLLICFVDLGRAQRITYSTREVARGFSIPWEMRMGPDGMLYFTEKTGFFHKMDPETGERKQLLDDRDVRIWNEAGMLGFDFHPDFPDSPYIYVAMVYGWPPHETEWGIFRYRYTGDSLVERVRIFGPAKASHTHNGARLVIRDRKIYFSLGEVWEYMLAQDLSSANGKVNRINLDGSIPEDNPFPGSSVWSLGHRNPQGLDFAPNGTLYGSEHGFSSDDEVNLIERGRNYGWPMIHGYCDSATDHPACEDLKVREPLMAFTPTIATGDIAYFDHATFPEWRHSILLATLKDQSLYHLKLDDEGKKILDIQRYHIMDVEGEPYGRLRAICLTKDGRIFLTTSNSPPSEFEPKIDRIFELTRTGIEPSSVTLIEPAADSLVDSATAQLTWHRAFIPAQYEVQVSETASFDGTLIFTRTSSDTSMFISTLGAGKTYFWRVRETVSSGPWSEVRTFRTAVATVRPEPEPAQLYSVMGRARSIVLKSESNELRANVEVFDILGRTRETRVTPVMSKNGESIFGPFDAGAYFVRVTLDGQTETYRIQVR